MACTHCGKDLCCEDAKFCHQCGSPVQPFRSVGIGAPMWTVIGEAAVGGWTIYVEPSMDPALVRRRLSAATTNGVLPVRSCQVYYLTQISRAADPARDAARTRYVVIGLMQRLNWNWRDRTWSNGDLSEAPSFSIDVIDSPTLVRAAA